MTAANARPTGTCSAGTGLLGLTTTNATRATHTGLLGLAATHTTSTACPGPGSTGPGTGGLLGLA
ncbi:hypothetical protein DDD63_09885 [Actinobaculum sp. 313]|nr:hypothetical protein DDD63_09885 [Actinobaculum sp. 313]